MTETASRHRPGVGTRLRRQLKAAVLSGPRRDRWQQPRRVVDALAIRTGMRVADIGSGGGYFTMRLARAVGSDGRVYAVDTDADLRSLVADRAAARDLANVTTVAPPEHDPGLPEPVDLAISVDAFHHLPDPPAYFRVLVERHLAPNGRVAVLEATPRWWLFGHATDPAVIRAALESAGLTIETDHDFLSRQSFLVGRRVRDDVGSDLMTQDTEVPRTVSATREVAAPARVIFELIADPSLQARWDGNDNLAQAPAGQRVRGVGDVFTMVLTMGSVRENHVVEFEEGRRIAWRPADPGAPPAGHLWRWELEPTGEGTTRVTHTYDWSQLTDSNRFARARSTTSGNLDASLVRLASLAEEPPAPPA